jgi:hypothetical protein
MTPFDPSSFIYPFKSSIDRGASVGIPLLSLQVRTLFKFSLFIAFPLIATGAGLGAAGRTLIVGVSFKLFTTWTDDFLALFAFFILFIYETKSLVLSTAPTVALTAGTAPNKLSPNSGMSDH